MPASTALASTAPTSSWAIAQAIEARLRAVLGTPPVGTAKPSTGAYVRWVSPPDDDQAGMIWAEEGVSLVWGDPQPVKNDGGGRAAQRVRRVIQAWAVTRSNRDAPGRSALALERHTNLEDLIVNALNDVIPVDFPTGARPRVGITLFWIPGGDEIRQKRKVSPDLYVSCLLFEALYVQPQHVRREVFE